MVRREAYDLCELAVVTALQAFAYDRPVVLLPAVIASRFQRGCIISYAPRGPVAPESLADRKIGVRAYTQTTGMWVRAHLAEDYGLPIERMRWVTSDEAHVAEYHDPDCVEAAPDGKSVLDMLRNGDVDAAILGNDLPKDDVFSPVIANAAAVDRAWWEKHGFMPINHMVVVSRETVQRHPDAVRAAYRLMVEADAAVRPADDQPQRTMFGLGKLRGPLQTTIDTCERQKLLPRKLTSDEVLGRAADILGDIGL
ncbi:MAG: type 2 periplasmic-binding domain-containing protein [Caulobacteraceae bacterium]